MGYKGNDKCLDKAYNDEKLFVLMTRDATAPTVVMEWIKLNLGCQPREKLIEALDCAIEMQTRCGEMIDRKRGLIKCPCCAGSTYAANGKDDCENCKGEGKVKTEYIKAKEVDNEQI